MNVFSVDFALLLYDEFDGSPIAGADVVFRREGGIVTPLRKRDGFYVFRGLNEPATRLEIRRPHYLPKYIVIEKSGLDPGFPAVHAGLLRKRDGVFADCDWVSGQCPPNSEVLVLCEEGGLRLQTQEADQKNLSVLGFATSRLVGRRYACDTRLGETFRISEMLSPNLFLADRPLPLPPGKPRPLIRAYLSQSGPDGRYDIPVDKGRAGCITATAYCGEEGGEWVRASQAEHS